MKGKHFLLSLILAATMINTMLVASSLLAEEKQIEESSRIVIGTELSYPPYSFLDEKGRPTGYNVEITQAIAEAVGLNIEIKIGPWAEIREALETGKIDAISGMFYSEERDKKVDFSPAFTIVHHAIFARADSPKIKSEDELRSKEIIVMRGDIMHDYVLEKGISKSPVLVETQADALRLLASGKNDYALVAELPGLYWINKLNLSNIIMCVAPPIHPLNYCYAVKEGDFTLLARLNEGLAIIKKTGQYRKIYDKWLGVLELHVIPIGTVLKYASLVLFPLLLLLGGSILWSQTLKRQVTKKTQELQREITERKKIEEALKATNQQLRASEQQLKAANQQLRASEQQLRAANQQLRASEQQLQAANQQLKANNLQLQIEIAERRKAEEALRKSEEQFRLLVEGTADYAIFMLDSTGHIATWNKGAERIKGYRAEEIIGKHFSVFYTSENIQRGKPEQELKKAEAEGRCEDEGWRVRRDGSRFLANAVITALYDESGNLYGFSKVTRDITERKKAEEMLYRVNRALKTISECNQALVRATDESNLLYEICRNLVGVGGYRLAWVGFAEQDKDKTVRVVAQAGYEEGYLENLNITWSDTEAGRGPTGTSIRTGKVCISRNILTDPNFAPWRAEAINRGYASSISIPIIAEGWTFGALNIYETEPDGFDEQEVKLLTELTNDMAYGIMTLRSRIDQKRAEESLKKLSSAVEQTADIVIITDKDGAIEYVNPTFEKVTGYVKEEAIGKTPRILKSGKHEQKFYELLWQTILSGKVFRETLINRKKNGEFYYAEKTITPIRDKKGDITHFVSTDKDITERKEIEKTQRLAQLGELVADMAHEVNNPLMIISGNAQLSLMEEIQSEKVRDNLKIIFDECRRAKDIIQRLLKFSRPSKGQLKEIDINKAIETVVGIIEHQFNLANIEIKRNYTENLHFILLDEQQMEEVFMNLLNNARDAMPEGGVIQIITSCEKDFLRIDFKDTGCGMTEEVMKRLFEPFFTTKEKGTGLGLSVCYGIIKAHNGELKFESEPGKGTTANVFLPLREAKENV